ncbi:MAG: hypothetical protein AAF578_00200 [Pseudomonadota bacterium]
MKVEKHVLALQPIADNAITHLDFAHTQVRLWDRFQESGEKQLLIGQLHMPKPHQGATAEFSGVMLDGEAAEHVSKAVKEAIAMQEHFE